MKRIVALNGGIGNQMFQYAFARMLETSRSADVEFDIGYYKKKGAGNAAELDLYDIGDRVFKDHAFYNRIRLMLQRVPFVSWIAGTYKEYVQFEIDPRVMKHDYRFYFGYWQNREYFRTISDLIRRELTYTGPVSEGEKKVISELRDRLSIAVHIRRGDYLEGKSTGIYHELGEDYYRRAIRIACEDFMKIDENSARIFFFSNDIAWCRERFSDLENATFVDNSISSSAHIDMLMMKNARCLIMANSTFSWWAAWLSDRSDKLVMIPDRWYNDADTNEKAIKALKEDKWILCSTEVR